MLNKYLNIIILITALCAELTYKPVGLSDYRQGYNEAKPNGAPVR